MSERPLSSVCAASGEGADEAQQHDEAVGGVTAARATCQNSVAVKLSCHHAPALDGAAVDPGGLREAFQPSCRHAVPQGRDQHDDRGEIDLAAEEARRWQRRPRPATVDGTAEAEASVVLGPEPAGSAPRLARIAGGMQRATAKPASLGACHVGEIAIAGEQQLMECGVGQQVSIQRMRPPHLDGADQHGQARMQ